MMLNHLLVLVKCITQEQNKTINISQRYAWSWGCKLKKLNQKQLTIWLKSKDQSQVKTYTTHPVFDTLLVMNRITCYC